MMVYQFPIRRQRQRAPEQPRPVVGSQQPAQQAEEVGLIQGQTPGSVEEWRVAVALWKYNLPFDYQWALYGGRLRKGGQIIDFIVYAPFKIPLYVNGEYWHQGQMGADDKLKLADAERFFGRPPVILWGKDLQTQEDANAAVARAFL